MKRSIKFVNPLLRPSEPLPTTELSTPPQVVYRKRGTQAFESTHERMTFWIDKELKARFERLSTEQEKAKATLLDEAIADLLKKYQA